MMFAEASNEFTGAGLYMLIAVLGFISSAAGVASYFATRREMEALEKRVSSTEVTAAEIRAEIKKDKEDLIAAGERRSFILHNRINPIIENTAGLKCSQEAFVKSFDNFTEVMRDMVQTLREERKK
jgi:hypothetical protein